MRKILLLATCMLLAFYASTAMADIIDQGTVTFSDRVSTDGADVDWFPAQIVWKYYTSEGNEWLDLTVINNADTTVDGVWRKFVLTEIFWSVDATLTLTGNGGFDGAVLTPYDPDHKTLTKADGFGVFDYKLDLSQGNQAGIQAGEEATFTFGVLGKPGWDGKFFTKLSETDIGGGNGPAIAALKFTQGVYWGYDEENEKWRWLEIPKPPGDSSYTVGSSTTVPIIPEPATNMLLGIGIAAMLIRRKMRKTA